MKSAELALKIYNSILINKLIGLLLVLKNVKLFYLYLQI